MAEKQKRIYPKGIIAFAPRDKAPSFVKGSIVITVDQLTEWIEENKQYQSDYKGYKQIRLDISEFDGKLSLSVNTFGLDLPNQTEQPAEPTDDLPF